MSEEEIIDKIEEEYDEKYLLIEALRNIFKGKKEKYDIQIITSQLLALYKEEKEKNQEHQKINGKLREEIERQGNTREIEEKYIKKNFISKDKIRNKIEEVKSSKENYTFTLTSEDIRRTIITNLQELLKEE